MPRKHLAGEDGSFGNVRRVEPKVITLDDVDSDDEEEEEGMSAMARLRKLFARVRADEQKAAAEIAPPPPPKSLREWWRGASPGEKQYFVLKWCVIGAVIGWLVVVNTLLRDTYDEVERIREINKTRKDDRYEARRSVGRGDATETAILAAILGWIFGPMLVLYGYQVMAFIVVLNAFSAAGLQSYVSSVQQIEVINADSAAGRMLPTQLTDLQRMLVSAFTISATALKIPPFDAAMKASIVVGIIVSTVLDQVPPLFGCLCEDGTVPCSTVYRHGQYLSENRCFWDRWFRFIFHYSFVLPLALKAMHHPQRARNANVAVLAASFMCSAIFDTVLAVLPHYGSRVQPYRMGGMILFTTLSHKIHQWMRCFDYERDGHAAEQIDADRTATRPATALRLPLRLVYVVGLVVMAPLRALDDFCHRLRLFGQQKMIYDEIENLGLVEHHTVVELTGAGKVQRELCVKLERRETHDKLCRSLVSIANAVLCCMALAVVGMTAQAIRDDVSKNVMRNGRLYLEMALGGASVVACLAGLGWCGSEFRSKKLLVPYSLILVACMLLQLVAAGFIYDFNAAMLEAVQTGLGEGSRNVSLRLYNGTVLGRDVDLGTLGFELDLEKIDLESIGRQWSSFKADSMEYVRLEMEHMHGEARCSFRRPSLPAELSCNRSTWYEGFVNEQCRYYNASDVLLLQGRLDEAMAGERWATASTKFDTLRRVRRISQGISACLAKHGIDVSSGVTAATPTGTFCTCRTAIAHQIGEVSRPIANVTIALAVMELLALVFVSIIMKNGDAIRRLQKKVNKVEAELALLHNEAKIEAPAASAAKVVPRKTAKVVV